MRAKQVNEKFSEESDPIEDLNVGIPELNKLKKDYEEFKFFFNLNETLNFDVVTNLLDNLHDVIAYAAVFHFREKYGIKIDLKLDPNEFALPRYDSFATGKIENYIFNFQYSTTANSIRISMHTLKGLKSTPNCRSIRGLDVSFKKLCKLNNINLKKKRL
jgi:hypothetical protein